MVTSQQYAPAAHGGSLAGLVAAEGSARQDWVVRLAAPGALSRDLADAVHSLCALHCGPRGVIDQALVRIANAPSWLEAAARAFADERALLARLTSAAGPIPSTPGQAACEAAVAAQRHAFETLATSEREGCALGAAAALMLDWLAIRSVIDAAAARFGVSVAPMRLPSEDVMQAEMLQSAASGRARGFAAQQLLAQHRGLWQLLESRAAARGSV